MSDLNVALVLRLVDRMSAPARGAARALGGVAAAGKLVARSGIEAGRAVGGESRALGGLATAGGRSARALTAGAQAATRLSRASTLVVGATLKLGQVGDASARSLATATTAASRLGAAARSGAVEQAAFARSCERSGSAFTRAATGAGMMERAMKRGQAASRAWRGEMERLDRRLGTVAKGSLAADAAGRAGAAVARPARAAVAGFGDFEPRMNGISILTGQSDKQLAPTKTGIFDTAQDLGMKNSSVLSIFRAVQNEGAYKTAGEQLATSRSVPKLALIGEVIGDEISETAPEGEAAEPEPRAVVLAPRRAQTRSPRRRSASRADRRPPGGFRHGPCGGGTATRPVRRRHRACRAWHGAGSSRPRPGRLRGRRRDRRRPAEWWSGARDGGHAGGRRADARRPCEGVPSGRGPATRSFDHHRSPDCSHQRRQPRSSPDRTRPAPAPA